MLASSALPAAHAVVLLAALAVLAAGFLAAIAVAAALAAALTPRAANRKARESSEMSKAAADVTIRHEGAP
eukprot:15001362-Heterocapsa_arctica.AAC.1